MIDTESKGSISIKELACWVVKAIGLKEMDIDTFTSISMVDANKNGCISRQEFYNFCVDYIINYKDVDFLE